MSEINLQFSFEELGKFVDLDELGRESWQHVNKVMNALGKHPVIPAWQTISKIGNSEIPEEFKSVRHFGIEAFFSSIISPEEKKVFRKDEHKDRINFILENPNKSLRHYDFKSSVEIAFCFNRKYKKSIGPRLYSRRLPIVENALQSFSEIIGARKPNPLTDMLYVATHATAIIILGFKAPRNEFENRVFLLRDHGQSTPFYRHIKVSFNKDITVIPGDMIYEFDGQIKGRRTVSIRFRAMQANEEVVHGTLEADFIAKPCVLRFTKDL